MGPDDMVRMPIMAKLRLNTKTSLRGVTAQFQLKSNINRNVTKSAASVTSILLSYHFEILHRPGERESPPLCKISKWLLKWECVQNDFLWDFGFHGFALLYWSHYQGYLNCEIWDGIDQMPAPLWQIYRTHLVQTHLSVHAMWIGHSLAW